MNHQNNQNRQQSNPISARQFGYFVSSFYCIGAGIVSYYTWPWGFIFFGPSIGGVLHYCYTIRNKVSPAYSEQGSPKKVSVCTQTEDSQDDQNSTNKRPLLNFSGLSAEQIPNNMLHQFNSITLSPIPGGANPHEGVTEDRKKNSVYDVA